jgi:hypothetical protein
VTTCSTPSGLAASNITASTATLAWAESCGASSYTVQYRPTSGIAYGYTTVVTATNSLALSGLCFGTTYKFRVKALCSGSFTAYSALGTFTTPNTPTCATPVFLTLASSATSFMVSWVNMSVASSQQFSWRLSGGAYTNVTLAPGINTYTKNGLAPGASYQFRIRAKCGATWESWGSTPIPLTRMIKKDFKINEK